MHIHILGICGTFMGGAAILARQLGHKVTGSDANVYPPMSTLLESQGIEIIEGFDPSQLDPQPDLVVIGNAMSVVTHVLNMCSIPTCATPLVRSGSTSFCCTIAGYWRYRVHTVKRLRRACWLGYSKTAVINLVS